MSEDDTSTKPTATGSRSDTGGESKELKKGNSARKKARNSARPSNAADQQRSNGSARQDQGQANSQLSQQEKGKATESQEDTSSKGDSRRRRSRGSDSKPGSGHDPGDVAKYAWKIYLAEISEEGVTLVDDRAARELARRCFELAVTFMDEKERQS